MMDEFGDVSAFDQSKDLLQTTSTSAIKEEKKVMSSDDSDSEDHKPLSIRLSAVSSKGKSQHSNTGSDSSSLNSPQSPKPDVICDDSDDEVPLSTRFQKKSTLSSIKCSEHDDTKTAVAKIHQNGSTTKDNQHKKSSEVPTKRPLGKAKSSIQSSVKRRKLVDESLPRDDKQGSAKSEPTSDEDEEEDHVPISQRLKQRVPSASKSSSAKQKITKVVPISFKKTRKSVKKVVEISKYLKSSMVAPGSGDKKKWATFVHNGVTFPPPYKPHGVKMLYKGKPVHLTPEQEEVATMYAVMLDTEYMNNSKFKKNFMDDWRIILGEDHVIQNLDDCDFTQIYEWHQKEKEKKNQMSSEVCEDPKMMDEFGDVSAFDQSKDLLQTTSTSAIKEEKKVMSSDDSDSEDHKPLSIRLSAVSSKGKSQHSNTGSDSSSLNSPQSPKPDVICDDSDDDVPLSTKFQKKSILSSIKSSEHDDTKTVVAKIQQNGSTTKDNQHKKSSEVSTKRPLGKAKSSIQSSVKRRKLVDESLPRDDKQGSAKSEPTSDEDEEEDHVPTSQRLKQRVPSASKSSSAKQKITKAVPISFQKTRKSVKKVVEISKYLKSSMVAPGSGDKQKWTTFVHNGVTFPPPYKPHGVKVLYRGKPVYLTPEQEEVATMYAVMLDTEYMNNSKFKKNFMDDWRIILGEDHEIQNLDDCDFTPIYEWHQKEKEKKNQMSSEEKKALKEEKLKLEEKYMWAIVDGVKQKVGNFRVEPPGLFRGRGKHPKMGKLKKRILPSDITINIGKDAPVPECPIPCQRWKEVRHDNEVRWLACWDDPIKGKEKYVYLADTSNWKGESEREKYEKARLLKNDIQGIRAAYTKDFTCKDITRRQIAVATYLIDKLALRAGNDKDDEAEAETVGCCTLKVENVQPESPNILKFDFLGKDSIRYENEVEVEPPVFKAIEKFRTGKKGDEDLFDQLDSNKLNAHLKKLMPGLTAKVFRTYNASSTLDDVLSRETKGGDVAEKIAVYQRANKEVAIICNHQRAVPKSHATQISKLNDKIEELKGVIDELKTDLDRAKKGKSPLKGSDGKPKKNLNPEKLERDIAKATARMEKMELGKESKEDMKTVAVGTSKTNYNDPRISVAWCKRHEVPIERIFPKNLLARFAWAMDVDPDFRF